MDPQVVIPALEEYYRKGMRYVIFSGGEAFLHPRVNEILDWLIGHDFYIGLNTNGQLIDRRKFRDFLLCFDEICVSIDGPKEINDRIRGKGSYDKVVRTIEFLRAHGKKVVLVPVLNRLNTNLNTLEFFLDMRRLHGVTVDYGKVTPAGSVADTAGSKELQPTYAQLRRFVDMLKSRRNREQLWELNDFTMEYLCNPAPIHCHTARYMHYINVDHDVYPCIYKCGDESACLGNLESGLKEDPDVMDILCDECGCSDLQRVSRMIENKWSIPIQAMSALALSLGLPRILKRL